ncbi:MAG: metallophosphoesterase family protein [Chitinophagaceae bacterium]|nr:metallophosphoesterase family protein [Anaerolineae bacterium]
MKIGVFSDVHGHLEELHKTLELLKHLQVDQLVCAGDLVEKGLHSDAVIDVMRELAIPCIQGNHDAKAQFTWLTYNEPLQDQSIVYLGKLPVSLTFEWAGVSVYMTHANPWQDSSVYVFPTRPTALFKLVAEAVDAEVIILGHTHHPMRVQIEGKTIINPGSIYGNRDREERTCGVLSMPTCDFELYDIDTGRKLSL